MLYANYRMLNSQNVSRPAFRSTAADWVLVFVRGITPQCTMVVS